MTSVTSTNQTFFATSRNRINIRGKVDADTTYRIRIRFDRDQDTLTSDIANYANNVDMFYVTNALTERLKITAGKLYKLDGGTEGLQSGMNLHSISYYYLAGRGPGIFQPGLQLDYSAGEDHRFTVQFVNSPYTNCRLEDTAGNEVCPQQKTKYLGTNFTYRGHILAWHFKPIITLGRYPHIPAKSAVGAEDEDVATHKFGVGFWYDRDAYHMEFDIKTSQTPEHQILADYTSATANVTDPSASILTFYTKQSYWITDQYKVQLQYSNDERKSSSKVTGRFNHYSAALEVYPSSKNLRYHFGIRNYQDETKAYQNDTLTMEQDTSTNTIFAGMGAIW